MNFPITKFTMDEIFRGIVKKFATRPALAFVGQEPFTYAEFGRRVTALRQQLRHLGLKQQDKIIILGSNSPNWAIAYMATITMGAVAVPVMDEFPESDVAHIINHSEARAIFISESLYQSLNLPTPDSLERVFSLSSLALFDEGAAQPEGGLQQYLPEKLRPSPGKAETEVNIQEDDLAEILYTSGTTGHSKGVMLTHKNLVTNLIAGPEVVGHINEESIILGILPLAHAFGCTNAFLSIIYSGASIYYLDRKPSPRILLGAMQQVQPTFLGAVPLIFEKIYQKQVVPAINNSKLLNLLVRWPVTRKPVHRLVGRRIKAAFGGRLECAIIGGASLAPEIELFLREAGIPYVCGYGLSECAPLVTGSSLHDTRFGSVGYAIRDVNIRIVDPNPESGIGEIHVNGPNVMRGYYKNEAETRKVFAKDGWLITGDRGYLDADGYLFIKGRSKNVIIGPSGENIYPEAVEDKLKGSPFVEEALVYQQDNQLVARIYPNYSYIETKGKGKDESAIAADIAKILEQVRRDTNAKLPKFSQIQAVIEQQAPFIKTPTNKIKRVEYVPSYQK